MGNYTFTLVLSALLASLILILLYFAIIVPFHSLFFTFLSSFPIAILVYRTHLPAGLLLFICTALLSLILFPHPRLAPYLLFFGHYGLCKIYLEKHFQKYSLLLKLLYSNFFFLLGLTLFSALLLPYSPPFSKGILILLFQPFFIIYDYSFSKTLSLLGPRIV